MFGLKIESIVLLKNILKSCLYIYKLTRNSRIKQILDFLLLFIFLKYVNKS